MDTVTTGPTKDEVELARKHVTALRGLLLNPGHVPMDGMCLDELRIMGLIEPGRGGYKLTAKGHRNLSAEEAAVRQRDSLWNGDKAALAGNADSQSPR
ncbi:hypothetical protein [Dongia sp.]|uniref:hypothetical protein n=1 Tax=Dongia sp. TaxID=1977262 RepID=UPI0035AE094B